MATEGPAILPSQFGRYTLLARLALGGMAEVFRAKIVSSHGFEKILVIKRILPHLASDKTFMSMFIDEAKLTAQLTHPKIVQILDFGEVGGKYFIALEFVDGFDALALLRTCAQKRMRLPLPLACFIAVEVLEALDYAHSAKDMDGSPMNLVHRDISPSNIFMSKGGDVKLGDFGIARAEERESKTQAGTLKGKYGYMSPEQVVGTSMDARSDLFAVGVVLAEMFMGRRLFTAANDLDVLLMVRDAHLDRLNRFCNDLPPALDRIVRRALKKDPEQRYQTAAEFRDDLAEYLFTSGRRVSTTDLRHFITDLFDSRPEAAARLSQQGRKLPEPPEPARREPAPAPAPGSSREANPAGFPARRVLDEATADLQIEIDHPRPGASPPPAKGEAMMKAPGGTMLGQALAQPLAVVDLDQWVNESERSSVRGTGWTPLPAGAPSGRGRTSSTRSDVGRFVSGAPGRPPDSAGDVSIISPMRVFSDLAVAQETGLLRFELAGHAKEVYLVGGAPESVNSNLPNDRFGEYLVGKGVLSAAQLEKALETLPQYAGKLGDTLVGLGILKPLDVFRLLSQQVRDRVIDVFAWTEGTFAFYRGVTNPQESFPLGLDTFEILGAGVLNLPYELLERRFASLLDCHLSATARLRIPPEAFRLGPTPGEVLEMLDGQRTLRAWMGHFTAPEELLTFLRALYLLSETDLAQFD
ncbi:MAG: eukaryotic-like serine/threonine-protein kinase [Myxococcales bacterium]|jgi:serine/threonine-protein kinase|nr:eukaryotic-like serine/threonine-protein kinase [Myxococcales bacterium]